MLIEKLKTTFADRCRKNPSYSLRALSRSIGMDSSTVSALLSGKRPLTLKTAKKIIEGLQITNPVEVQSLLVETFANEEVNQGVDYRELEMETAEMMSSWEHHAILVVLELKDLDPRDRVIADRLNIPLGIASDCLSRLEKLGMVIRGRRGWELVKNNNATPQQVPSAVLRQAHRQKISKALESLEHDPIDVRDMSAITMAISKRKLPEAKKMITEFRRKLSNYLEDGKKDAVYNLNIQLFPLSKEKTT